VVKGEGSQLSWDAVPYAICYVVTKNGEVAGFTTLTTFDGYTASDQWQVQAVNEFGGLSKKGTANAATSISEKGIVISEDCNATLSKREYAAPQYYTVDGKRLSQMQRGLNIVRTADGKVKKVVMP
jgi:hypothetical protein